MILTHDIHNRVSIVKAGSEGLVYYTVRVVSMASGRVKTNFTVTKGELDVLISALDMLKAAIDLEATV